VVSAASRAVRLVRRSGMPLAAVALGLGCELAETVAPTLETRVVVHAVLNPLATQQIVIVEKTLQSSVSVSPGQTPRRDGITGARVVIYGPRQDSSVAVADAATAGVYRLASVTISDGSPGAQAPNVLRIRPGERYRLRVETPLGVVTGATTIPVGGAVDVVRRTFNVDRDTLGLNTSAVRNAAGYLLRHETRISVQERYVTALDASLILPLALAQGDPDLQAWSFSFVRGLVLPGLAQTFMVVAVDSNYFRYYVAGYDPFGDDTRGNSLTGGVGMFGSVATLMSKTMDLIADVDTPPEGSWIADRNSLTLPFSMTLYASPFFPSASFGTRISLSGRGRLAAGRQIEVYGNANQSGASVEIIDPTQSTRLALATGAVNALGALVLTDSQTGERVTYRRP
jgi:hypothetical protein